VDYRTYGMRDMSTATPMTKDTNLPRLLHDQARHRRRDDDSLRRRQVLPSDPISKYIPEFAHLKVFNGFDANGKMLLADPDPRADHA